jgi:flavin reductase (DIM6/NTAB) family NADH-FMN oxidoreductase RutF
MDKVYRLNLINSLTGIKPVNLVGTISKTNITNLAIISSVVHLSSSPALLGFMLRPTTVPRHSYSNIHETGEYSINMVSRNFTDKAHYTSAKFDSYHSEFDQCGLSTQFFKESKAPCVAESPLKILLKFEEEYYIKSSRTILMVGSIRSLYLPQNAVDAAGMIDMEGLEAVGVSGLNTYYSLTQIATYPYARTGQFPQNQI